MYVCNLERREKDEILLMQREAASYGTRVDEKIEDQIMSFYDKHDEALSEFRDIDHNLRDRIEILEATVMAEVKTLSSKKTNRWAWLIPFCIIMTLLGAFAAYSRGKLKRLRAASF